MVREVWEETGLAASINGYLGVAEYDMSEYGRADVQERHVFQLEAPASPPQSPGTTCTRTRSGGACGAVPAFLAPSGRPRPGNWRRATGAT